MMTPMHPPTLKSSVANQNEDEEKDKDEKEGLMEGPTKENAEQLRSVVDRSNMDKNYGLDTPQIEEFDGLQEGDPRSLYNQEQRDKLVENTYFQTPEGKAGVEELAEELSADNSNAVEANEFNREHPTDEFAEFDVDNSLAESAQEYIDSIKKDAEDAEPVAIDDTKANEPLTPEEQVTVDSLEENELEKQEFVDLKPEQRKRKVFKKPGEAVVASTVEHNDGIIEETLLPGKIEVERGDNIKKTLMRNYGDKYEEIYEKLKSMEANDLADMGFVNGDLGRINAEEYLDLSSVLKEMNQESLQNVVNSDEESEDPMKHSKKPQFMADAKVPDNKAGAWINPDTGEEWKHEEQIEQVVDDSKATEKAVDDSDEEFKDSLNSLLEDIKNIPNEEQKSAKWINPDTGEEWKYEEQIAQVADGSVAPEDVINNLGNNLNEEVIDGWSALQQQLNNAVEGTGTAIINGVEYTGEALDSALENVTKFLDLAKKEVPPYNPDDKDSYQTLGSAPQPKPKKEVYGSEDEEYL